MTNNHFLLALGAFFTSSGFGGLAALIAAGVAYRKLRSDQLVEETKRVDEKDATRDADVRERWWAAVMWLWENRGTLDDESKRSLIAALAPLARTSTQIAFLKAIRAGALPAGSRGQQP